MKHTISVKTAYQSRPDAQVAIMMSLRPYPGFVQPFQPSLRTEAVNTSGLDSLLVIVRVLEASGCQFSKSGLTDEETAVLKAARTNLGMSKESDSKVKLELITTLFPRLTVQDLTSYIDQSLETYLILPCLANIWINNENFRFKLSLTEYMSPYQNSVRGTTPVKPEDFQPENSVHSSESNVRGQKNINSTIDSITFHPPFLRFAVSAAAASQLQFKDILRTKIVSWKKNASSATEVTYCLLMVIRHADTRRLQDRVRVYYENGHEVVSLMVRESPFTHTRSVRKPEAWRLKDGGALTLIYKRCSPIHTPNDEDITEYDVEEVLKEAYFLSDYRRQIGDNLYITQARVKQFENQFRSDQKSAIAHSMNGILAAGHKNSRQSAFDYAPVGYKQVTIQIPPDGYFLLPGSCKKCNQPQHGPEGKCVCLCGIHSSVHEWKDCPSACFCASDAHHLFEDHLGGCDFEHGGSGIYHPASWCDLCQVCGAKHPTKDCPLYQFRKLCICEAKHFFGSCDKSCITRNCSDKGCLIHCFFCGRLDHKSWECKMLTHPEGRSYYLCRKCNAGYLFGKPCNCMDEDEVL